VTVHQTATGRTWHWPNPHRPHLTACTSWPHHGPGTNPVSVDIDDRCSGPGCRQAWERWIERTIRLELAAALARSRDENERAAA
jgi:hypothetical protein